MFGQNENREEEIAVLVEETVKTAPEEDTVPTEIVFTDNGVSYVLGFDRASAMKAEKMFDLSLSEAMSGKASAIQSLFFAAFIKNHPHIKPRTMQQLWNKLEDKQGLYEVLVGMYGNTAGSVLEEPEQGKGIGWKAR